MKKKKSLWHPGYIAHAQRQNATSAVFDLSWYFQDLSWHGLAWVTDAWQIENGEIKFLLKSFSQLEIVYNAPSDKRNEKYTNNKGV